MPLKQSPYPNKHLTLPSAEGPTYILSDYRGQKNIVLAFYRPKRVLSSAWSWQLGDFMLSNIVELFDVLKELANSDQEVDYAAAPR